MVFPFFSQFGKRKEYVRGRGGKEVWKERLGPNPGGPRIPVSTKPAPQEQGSSWGRGGCGGTPGEGGSGRQGGAGKGGESNQM